MYELVDILFQWGTTVWCVIISGGVGRESWAELVPS